MQSPGGSEHAAAGNVISFQYNNGADVTIIVSKNAGRFRLQSSRFEAIWRGAVVLSVLFTPRVCAFTRLFCTGTPFTTICDCLIIEYPVHNSVTS